MDTPQTSSFGKWVGWVVLGVVILIGLWTMSTYNSLVTLRENAKTQGSNVEAQYQRRFDLFQNLEGSVKGILKQEQAVFGTIAEARSRYAGTSSGSAERVGAINQLDGALGRLLVVMENYPDLKSAENVVRLQDEIAGTENRVAVERSRYNETVNGLNQRIQFFPSNVIAGIFHFEPMTRFEVQVQEAKTAPKINLEVK